MKKWVLIIFFALFLIPNNSIAIIINEIMYNSTQDDNYNEWIEIFNNENYIINIENWTLCDKKMLKGYISHYDNLTYSNYTYEILADSFALITDGKTGTQVYQNFNVSQNSIALHVDAASICNGLPNNISKSVFIKNKTDSVIDNITYQPIAKKGNTTCLINSEWKECTPTPGSANILFQTSNSTQNQTSNNTTNATANPSYISITSYDSSAMFGSSIDVEMEIYRNETNSYAVYVYVQGDEKISSDSIIHAKRKNMTYKVKVPVQLKSNCDSRYSNGTYTLVAEGLDTNDTKTISVSGLSNCKIEFINQNYTCPSCPACAQNMSNVSNQTNILYKLVSYPSEAFAGETIEIKANITSISAENFTLYSYIFDGSSLASEGGWDGNKIYAEMPANSSKIIFINNTIKEDAKAGKYNLRVRIKNSGEHDLTGEIMVKEKPAEQIIQSSIIINETIKNETASKNNTPLPITGMAAAKSSSDFKDFFAAFSLIFRMLSL